MKPTTCPDQDSLQQLLLGQMPEEQAQPLEEHLLHCDRCSSAADTISGRDKLTTAIQPPDEYQDDDENLVQAIEQAKQLHPAEQPKETNASGTGHSKSPAAADTLKPGQLFGRYRIQKELGAGAMGKVLLAEDTVLGRQVALKIPRFSDSLQQETLDRFLREAQAAATIDHANICPIYDIGELDGVHYISMAFIEGRPLSAYISGSKPLQQRAVAMLVRKLALGLAAAHDKGIVHRDLKPDNIMIKQGNEPVVMDFGLAFNQETRVESRMTQEGTLLGSPAYMSVEQVEGRIGDVGPQSDIYSLGVILYELLTSKIPFDGNVTAVIGQILTQTPPPPSQLRDDVDPELESICLKMMSRSPGDRHKSMEEVTKDLTAFLREGSASTSGGNKADDSGSELSEKKADATPDQQVKKLEQQKQQIETLLENSEFTTAIGSLKKMASIKSPKLAKYANWAQQQLQKAKQETRDLRGSSASLYRTASELCDLHDYEEAIEILEQVPQEFRDMKIKTLLQECVDLLEELEILQADIDRADSLKKYDDLQPTVERLLEIQPNDRRAKRLLKELKTYGKGGGMRLDGRRDSRFDAAGNTSSPIKVALFIGIPLLLFGLVSWATVIYVRSGDQTVKIEVDDPNVKVTIDGEVIEITGVGDTIKLKQGMHKMIVERGDTRVHTRDFEVIKGNNPALHITVADTANPAAAAVPVAQKNDEPVAVVPTEPKANKNENGEFVKLHQWPGEGCDDLEFSADGKWGIGVRSETTFVWDLETGDVLKAMKGQTTYLRSMDMSPDGRRVVAGFRRGDGVAVFSTANSKLLRYFKGHERIEVTDLAIYSVAISPDSKKAVSVGGDMTIRLWDIETVEELLKIEKQHGVVKFLPDGRFLSAWKEKIHIWDPATGEETQTIDEHNSQIDSIAVSHDGKSLIVGLTGEEILIWQLEPQRVIQRISAIETADVAISNDGRRLLSCGNDRVVLWDLSTGKKLGTADQKKVSGVAISPDGTKGLSNGKSYSSTILWQLP